ncbi:MAG TPA: LuxR C-terminal-related transcriptional regulator [Bosea sp. (in: a-proteobacteria)]|nr:LuxR C-terminal-related transcriptional regulator [Bosea sp. (in: a-proteobacteria)]
MSALVHLVVADAASRAGIGGMLRACGYRTEAHADAGGIVDQISGSTNAGCIVIDTQAPDVVIPDVVYRLNQAGLKLPVIVLADQNDARIGIRAIRAGAEDFFAKPVGRDEFIEAIDRAIARHRLASEQNDWVHAACSRLRRLTRRERQVFDLVVHGKMNKQIAFELGTTERTIKAHRHNVMEKMRAGSVIQLVTCAERLGLLRPSFP